MAINPRKVLNIPIPSFKEGQPANITIIDIKDIWTVDISKFKSISKNSPYDKRLLTGRSLAVINKGKMFYNNEFIEI